MISLRRRVPVGVHHRIPADQTFTRVSSTIRDPQDPPPVVVVPVLSAPVRAPLPQREPAADPAPVVTETVFHRGIREDLEWGYRNLPLFREGVADKFVLHQLAMRAPCTTKTGGKVA